MLLNIDGDLDKAKMYIEKSIKVLEGFVGEGIEKKDKLEKYYRLSAYLHDITDEPIEALRLLNKTIAVNPELNKDYDFGKWLVDLKFSTNDFLGTLKDVNILIESFPGKAELFETKGLCLYMLDDNIGAINAYSKAIEISPKSGNLYRLRGLSKYNSNDNSGACFDWSKAGELGDYKAYDHIKELCGR